MIQRIWKKKKSAKAQGESVKLIQAYSKLWIELGSLDVWVIIGYIPVLPSLYLSA